MSELRDMVNALARDLADEIWTEDEPNAAEIDLMLKVALSDTLAAHDRAVWEDGWHAGVEDERNNQPPTPNPYEAKP